MAVASSVISPALVWNVCLLLFSKTLIYCHPSCFGVITLVFQQVALLTPSCALCLITPSVSFHPFHFLIPPSSLSSCYPIRRALQNFPLDFSFSRLPVLQAPYQSCLLTPPDKVVMTTLADAYLSQMVNGDNRLPLAGFIEVER